MVADDILLVHLERVVDSDVPGTITYPAGWTQLRQDDNGGEPVHALALAWKRATASEPANYTFSWAVASDVIGRISAWSGRDTGAGVIDVHGGQANASSTSITAPSVTTTVASVDLVFIGALRGLTSVTPPTGMTERWDSNHSGAIDNMTMEGADEVFAGPGATGTRVGTALAAGVNIGQLVALAPAAAGVTLTPAPVTAAWGVPTPAVQAGPVTITPAPVVASWAVPAATIISGQTLTPAPVTAAWGVPTPAVQAGPVTLTPAPVTAAWVVPTATVVIPAAFEGVGATKWEFQRAVAKNPRGLGLLYAVIEHADGLVLFKSSDGGTNWTSVSTLSTTQDLRASILPIDTGSQFEMLVAYAPNTLEGSVLYRRLQVADAAEDPTIGAESTVDASGLKASIQRDRNGRVHVFYQTVEGGVAKVQARGSSQTSLVDAPTWSAAADIVTYSGFTSERLDWHEAVMFTGTGNLGGVVSFGFQDDTGADGLSSFYRCRNITDFDGTSYTLGTQISFESAPISTSSETDGHFSLVVDSGNFVHWLRRWRGPTPTRDLTSRKSSSARTVVSWDAFVTVDASTDIDSLSLMVNQGGNAIKAVYKRTASSDLRHRDSATGTVSWGGESTVAANAHDFYTTQAEGDGTNVHILYTENAAPNTVVYVSLAEPSVGVVLTPAPVVASWAVPTPAVVAGPVTLIPAAVSAAWGVPVPLVIQRLAPAAVVASWGVPTPTVVAGPVTLTSAPTVANWAVPTPAVQVGAVTLTPAAVVANWLVPTPNIVSGVTLTPAPVVAAWGVPTPTVQIGAVTLTPAPTVANWAVPTPTVQVGAVTLVPAPTVATWAVPTPSIFSGVTLTPAPVVASWVVPVPTVQAGAVTLTPGAVAASWSVPVPTVVAGPVIIAPAPVAASWSVPDPTVAQRILPAPVTAAWGAPTPAVLPGAVTLLPGAVQASWVVPVPTVAPGAVTLTPVPVSAQWVVPTPVIAPGVILTGYGTATFEDLDLGEVEAQDE